MKKINISRTYKIQIYIKYTYNIHIQKKNSALYKRTKRVSKYVTGGAGEATALNLRS